MTCHKHTEFANMAAVTRYPEEFRLRLPRGMPDALALAAGQHHTTPTEWARQALLRSLQAEGVSLRDGTAAISERRDAPLRRSGA